MNEANGSNGNRGTVADGGRARPVETLREYASKLEAALSVSYADPKPKAVHALRSETRRIEAQVDLLSTMHGLAGHRTEADRLLRRLKRLRSAAGKVRDCDVQSKLLKNGKAQLDAAPEAPADTAKGEKRLRKALDRRRERYESKLVELIKRQQPKVTRDVEALMKALQPSAEMEAAGAPLLAAIEERFGKVLQVEASGEEHLHEIRKTAKRARYQCEGVPGAEAQAMARQYEALQDAGGAWHDLLELTTRAHGVFGPDHPLCRVLEHRRDQRLDSYTEMLERLRAEHPAKRRKARASGNGAEAKLRKTAAKVARASGVSKAKPRVNAGAAARTGRGAARAAKSGAGRRGGRRASAR